MLQVVFKVEYSSIIGIELFSFLFWLFDNCHHFLISAGTETGRSRTAVTSKMERFVIIVNGFQPLNIITKHSILDVAAVLDSPVRS